MWFVCLLNKPNCGLGLACWKLWSWFSPTVKVCSLHLQLKFSMPVMARIILPSGWSLLIGFDWSPWFISFSLSISRAFFERRVPSPGVGYGYRTLWFLLQFPGLEVTWVAWVLSCSVENPILFCGPEPAAWCLSQHQILHKSLRGAACSYYMSLRSTRHWYVCSCGNGGLCGHSSMKAGSGLCWG